MISVKKQGPFEVFSRGVEEPWAIWRDGSFHKQAWTWAEVEAILRGETKSPNPVAKATDATEVARRASAVADREGTIEAHRAAGRAHRLAEKLHVASGSPRQASAHAETAREQEHRVDRWSKRSHATMPSPEALGTVKLGTTTHHVLSENPNGLTIRGPKGGVSHLVPTTNQPDVYAHNKIGKLAAAYYRREADGTFTKIR
jgi:hypothetical protein